MLIPFSRTQKRKSCTLSQTRSLRDLQDPRQSRVRSLDSKSGCSSKSGSSPRRRQQLSAKNPELAVRSKRPINRKEVHKSLESLFDLRKPFGLCIEDFQLCRPPVEEKSEDSDLDFQFGKPEDFIQKLQPVFEDECIVLRVGCSAITQYRASGNSKNHVSLFRKATLKSHSAKN